MSTTGPSITEGTHDKLDLDSPVSSSLSCDTKIGTSVETHREGVGTDPAADEITLIIDLLCEHTSISYRSLLSFTRFDKSLLWTGSCFFLCSVIAITSPDLAQHTGMLLPAL